MESMLSIHWASDLDSTADISDEAPDGIIMPFSWVHWSLLNGCRREQHIDDGNLIVCLLAHATYADERGK